MRRGLLTLVAAVLLALALPVYGQDRQKGTDAYKRGDYATAFEVLMPVARTGNPGAQVFVGKMYELGQGMPQDYAEAVRWYRLATVQGISMAQSFLGSMYASGRGVPEDRVEAAKWFRLAAEKGDASAQLKLGFSYVTGEGVPKDYVLAYMWINLAAAQGLELAVEGRDLVAGLMTPADISEAQRLERAWLETHQ